MFFSCQSLINLKKHPPFENPCLYFDELSANKEVVNSIFKDTAHHKEYIKQLMTYMEDTSKCKICYTELEVPVERLEYEPCYWTTKRFAALRLIEALFQNKQKLFHRFHYLNYEGRKCQDLYCLRGVTYVNCKCCWVENLEGNLVALATPRKKYCHVRDSRIIKETFEWYKKWYSVIEKKGLNNARKERLDIKSFTNDEVYWTRN